MGLFWVNKFRAIAVSVGIFAANHAHADAGSIYDVLFRFANAKCPVYVANKTNKIEISGIYRSPEAYAKRLSIDLPTANALLNVNQGRYPIHWVPTNAAIRFWTIPDDINQKTMAEVFKKIRTEDPCVDRLYSVSLPGLSGNDRALVIVHVYDFGLESRTEIAAPLQKIDGRWEAQTLKLLNESKL